MAELVPMCGNIYPEARAMPDNRTSAGTFAPGVSGNPGGRPKGIASYVRSKTRDGEQIVKFMLDVFHGKAIKAGRKSRTTGDRIVLDVVPTLTERIEAAHWLAERGFGKAVQAMEVSGPEGSPIEYSEIAASVRTRLAALAAAREAGAGAS
jgi:hypothetical protein